MPRTIPEPKLQKNGNWKLRITTPPQLRSAGFLDGRLEWIKTHPPCEAIKAQAWAAEEWIKFQKLKESFLKELENPVTSKEIADYRKLREEGQENEDALHAADALFDAVHSRSYRKHRPKLDGLKATEWEALEATPEGRKVLGDLDRLTGGIVDYHGLVASWLAVKKLKESSRKSYEKDVTDYLKDAPERQPFEKNYVSQWYFRELEGGRLTAKTIKRKLTALKGFHAYLLAKGVFERDSVQGRPFEDLSALSLTSTKTSVETRAWTDEEAVLLYRTAKLRHPSLAPAVALAMFTGGRIESLYRLRARDIDIDQGTILLGAEGDKTDAGSNRLIPMHPLLVPLLASLKAQKASEAEYLLTPTAPSQDKRSHSESKRFGRLKDKLFPNEERAATFHSFRSTFVTKLANEALTPTRFIKDIVGHEGKSPDITMDGYRGNSKADQMRPYVEKVSYEGLDSL